MNFIFFVFILFIIFTSLFVPLFFIKKFFSPLNVNTEKLLNFSIVIALKNESNNLTKLINSLKKLNYNPACYEVIFVDDNSTDNSLEMLKLLTSEVNNAKIIQNTKYKNLAKKGALTTGIEITSFPYIVITDADCIVEPDWLHSFNRYFINGTDLVFGSSPFIFKNTFLNNLICFENFRIYLLYLTANNLNLTYSAAARSFGFSKSAFEKLGGYSSTLVTKGGDDDLLIKQAVLNGMKISSFASPGSRVFSDTKETFYEYIKQKNRHIKTSFHYTFKHQIILAVWHFANILLLFSPLLCFFSPLFIVPFISKLILDVIIVKKYQKYFNYRFNVLSIVLHQVIYELLVIFNFLNSAFFKFNWK